MTKKILFMIHDLGQGGAEKVLVNLVNNMDRSKFDISVTALFGGGVNEQFLKPGIHFRAVFPRMIPGNSKWMKLLTPRQLHKLCVKEQYDIEVSYLEGPSARIVSGCPDPNTRLASWIHCTMRDPKEFAEGFRSVPEARNSMRRMHTIAFVSRLVRDAFLTQCPYDGDTVVLYNTNESEKIQTMAREEAELAEHEFCWCGVGKLMPIKGFDRMIRIQKRLRDGGIDAHLYILGEGAQRKELEALVEEQGVGHTVNFLGYQTNPYKYVANCELFVCASHAEGFSTAATEALIVGTPVCTVEVSGMKEMLGDHNEYGVVVPNDDEALYQAIRGLLTDPERLAHYKKQAQLRGKAFSTQETVRAVEEMLMSL